MTSMAATCFNNNDNLTYCTLIFAAFKALLAEAEFQRKEYIRKQGKV